MIVLRGLLLAAAVAINAIAASEAAPVYRQDFPAGTSIAADAELVVAGSNPSDRAVTMVIRLDDALSGSYATRVNEERVVPPGPFELRFAPGSLRTPTKRRLDLAQLRRLIVFTADRDPPVRLDRAEFVAPPRLPESTLGLDLGPAGKAVWPGFEHVAPSDGRLKGRALRGIMRPGGDALTGDGIQGIERIAIPWPNGAWRLTLWIEDFGEWEYLPHPLQRRIRVNGRDVFSQSLRPSEWIEQRYLAGRPAEAVRDGDIWDVVGSRRGGRVTAVVDVSDGELRIDLAGDSPAATFLAGMLIEPKQGRHAEVVEEARATRFRNTWRLVRPAPPGTARPGLSLAPHQSHDIAVARGTFATVDFWAGSDQDEEAQFTIDAPPALAVTPRVGHWRFVRENPAATAIGVTADHLRGDVDTLRLSPMIDRRINLQIAPAPESLPGRHLVTLRIATARHEISQVLAVEILPTLLPPADRPIGIYLDRAPHLEWFDDLGDARADSLACDLALLSRLGLSGLAPPFSTPLNQGSTEFLAEVEAARAAGFRSPLLAYSIPKNLARARGWNQTARVIDDIEHLLARKEGGAQVLWAIADEPSNPGRAPSLLDAVRALREIAPGALLAGQLNNPSDVAFLRHLDVALINGAYGIDEQRIREIRRHGAKPWYYNLGNPRLAAGSYLWRTGAEGFLQWHGRMPTADPFDPTDGRESDVQFLYPTREACPAIPDIDAQLLEIAAGIVDLRWLLWLDQRAQFEPQAELLRSRIRAEIPGRWTDASALTAGQAAQWRDLIIGYARRASP